MLTPLPFALHASSRCVPHAELALSLAAVFGDVEADALDERLDDLAAHLPAAPAHDPLAQLRALALLMRDGAFPATGHGVEPSELLIDRALADGRAAPLTRALVAIEVGRRHGLEIGLVSNGSDHCVAHQRLDQPLLVRAADAALVDAHVLDATPAWQCSHEACGLALDALEHRWLRLGRIGEAIRTAELRLHLPLTDDCMHAAGARLERLRAHLN